MAVPKHPIAHSWIKQTLIPFLLYAFVSTLPYPADISYQVQCAIDFCLRKPDHPSDGNDLVFERIFMAIMHRHKNLDPDLKMVVGNLDPLAKYLIRRAQLKGPYELLARTDIGSGAWIQCERERLSELMIQPDETGNELRPPMRPPSIPAKPPLTDSDVDPRLVHAQPGRFAEANVTIQLTSAEEAHYRRQNHEFEQYRLRRQQQPRQTYTPAIPIQNTNMSYIPPAREDMHAFDTYDSPYQQTQQQQAPPTLHMQQQKTVPLRQATEPQSYPPFQPLQPQMTTSTSEIPKRHPPAHFQLDQPQPTQYPTTLYQPFHYPAHHYPHIPLPSQPHPQHNCTSTYRSPFHTQSDSILNTDLAHLRTSASITAAQQRARDIAAKVSAWERDLMAGEIMERQQGVKQIAGSRVGAVGMGNSGVRGDGHVRTPGGKGWDIGRSGALTLGEVRDSVGLEQHTGHPQCYSIGQGQGSLPSMAGSLAQQLSQAAYADQMIDALASLHAT